MNTSIKIALAILLGLVTYFAARSIVRGSLGLPAETAQLSQEEAVPEALYLELASQPHTVMVSAKGRTAPDKTVTVKAGTTGTVVATPAAEGSFVNKGALLCGLDVEARSARVKEAEAQRDAARVDYEATAQLAEKGHTAANQVATAKAKLDAAEAAVDAAKVELSKTQIRAPFAGIFESRLAEAGDFLTAGQGCGVLVDMDPVIVAVEVSETVASRLAAGMEATARLSDGTVLPAKLRYVARTANERTRTFPVEAALETGDATIAAGVTAELMIPVGERPATLISPGLLTLSDTGQLGVRYVDEEDIIRFAPVEVIDESPQGAWVTGLPAQVRVVSLGQDYLAEGVHVEPLPAGGAQR